MKKNILIILILTFALKSEVILEAIGYGKTVLESQDSAIEELSGIIISNVDSKYIKREVVTNGKVDKATSRFLLVTSKTILKGVAYRELAKEGREFVSKAIFTRKALNSTIEYLENRINLKGYRLSRKELREKLEVISFLKPLLGYSLKKSYFAEKKEREFLSYLNQAQIQFHTVPKNTKIEISGKEYANFESIFLSGGKYRYKISKNGYFSETGYLRVSNGEKLIKNIILVKNEKSKKTIFLDIENREYREYFEEYLPNYGISFSENSKFRLKVTVSKKFVTKLDDYKFYNLVVEVKLYKNGNIFKTKRAKMKNKTLNYIDKKSSKISKSLIKHLFSDSEIKRYFR